MHIAGESEFKGQRKASFWNTLLFNHEGLNLKMNSVLLYDSQIHSVFQYVLKVKYQETTNREIQEDLGTV